MASEKRRIAINFGVTPTSTLLGANWLIGKMSSINFQRITAKIKDGASIFGMQSSELGLPLYGKFESGNIQANPNGWGNQTTAGGIMLDFEFDEPEGVLYCRFHDRMDSVKAMEASAVLSDKLAALGHSVVSDHPITMTQASPSPVGQITFDLAQVDYVSSGFMRLCLHAAKQVQEGGFSIVNTKPLVMKVFKVAGLDELLKVS